jgi:RHS repeat-associated protein
VRQLDQAGVLEIDRYGIGDQALGVTRRLCADHKAAPDWIDPALVALDAQMHRTTYRVDALERVVENRLADGTALELAYDGAGGIKTLHVTTADGAIDHQPFVASAEYNARGQRTRVRFGNGTETTWSFDELTHRIARATTRSVAGPPRTWIDVAYTHDPAGNLIEWVDHAQEPGGTTALISGLTVSSASRFTYDAYYRLVQATGRVHQALLPHDAAARHLSINNGAAVERYEQTYTYDAAGNMTRLRHQGTTQSWTTDFWVSTTSNRSLQALDANGIPLANPEAAFDGGGNCIRLDHLRALHWDAAGWLERATIVDRSAAGEPDDAEHYRYDADGERVRRVTERLVAGQLEVTDTIYLPGCEIRRVHRGGNTSLLRTTAHVTDGVARIATLHQWSVDALARETDAVASKKVHYQVGNHLGSVSLELDADARVVSYEEYFPYGGTSFIAGDDVRDFRLKEVRYSGKIRDEATGFHYYGFRYLAPSMCRWLSADPAGPVDGPNLYQFVKSNPIRYVDADGLQTKEVTLHISAESKHLLYQNTDVARAKLLRAILSTTHKLDQYRVKLRGTVQWRDKQNVFVQEPGTEPEIVGEISFEEWSDSEGVAVPSNEEALGMLIGPMKFWEGGGGTDIAGGEGVGGGVNAWGTGAGSGAGGEDPSGLGKGDAGSDLGGGESTGEGVGNNPLGSATNPTASAGGGPPGGNGTKGAKGKTGAPGSKAGDGKKPGGKRKKGNPGGSKGGSPLGTAGGVIGGADDGVLGAPLAPEGFPTGPDGVEYGGEAMPPGEYEIGDTTRAGAGQGDAPGSAGGEESGNGSGEKGNGAGASGGSTEGSEGGRPDGSTRGINIGGGTVELPAWLDTALDASLDYVQGGLDVVGLIPILGEIADGVNGLISLFRGDLAGAGLSFAAMIPFAGWGATGAKWGMKGGKALGIGIDVGQAALKNGDKAAAKAAVDVTAKLPSKVASAVPSVAAAAPAIAPKVSAVAGKVASLLDDAKDWWSKTAGKNAYSSLAEQYLYVITRADTGAVMKYGTTWNLFRRYSKRAWAKMEKEAGGTLNMELLAQGNTRFIRDMERQLIQRYEWITEATQVMGKKWYGPPLNKCYH